MSSIDAKWHENRLPYANGTLWQIGRILWKHLADFLKTTRTKFAVICVKKRQKVRFLSPRSSNERRKRKGQKERARRKGGLEEKKSNGCTLSFHNSYFEDCFWPKKLLNAKGLFGDNVIKYPNRWSIEMSSIDSKWPETQFINFCPNLWIEIQQNMCRMKEPLSFAGDILRCFYLLFLFILSLWKATV